MCLMRLERKRALWAASAWQRVDSDFNCQQQDIEKNERQLVIREGVLFYYDNARPRVLLVTRYIFWSENFAHLPYSLDNQMAQDLVVCFCEDPQNFFNGVNLSSMEEYRKHLPLFVARKFYSDRFSVLQER